MADQVKQEINITEPPIDELLKHTGSKYALAVYSAKRAREINSYYKQLNSGFIESVGPLVESKQTEKPISVAMREINADMLALTDGIEARQIQKEEEKRLSAQFEESISAGVFDGLGDLGESLQLSDIDIANNLLGETEPLVADMYE
jgi:DNA-directed RNA polymerase subunit omega